MTDNEIIKALECCVNDDEGVRGFCNKGCPLFGKAANCPEVLRKNALDLINRQNTEIEELYKSLDKRILEIQSQKAEIERLEKDRYIFKDGVLELIPRTDIEEIKSEAIKEFAERLTDIFPLFEALPKAMDIVMKEMGLKEE